MITRLRSYLRRVREQDEPSSLLDKYHVPEIRRCRTCAMRGQVELSHSGSDRVEYLCYDDLGTFLELFADQGIKEWTVVRL